MPTKTQGYVMIAVVVLAVGGAGIASLGEDSPSEPANDSVSGTPVTETETKTPDSPATPSKTPTRTPSKLPYPTPSTHTRLGP